MIAKISFDDYLDKWMRNLSPDKRAKWDAPETSTIPFCAKQWVLNDIREEYNTGIICPIMELRL
jgi:hypothetical protein